MAVVVTSQLTTIDACEATTDWAIHNRAGTMGALAAIDATDEEVPPKEGTYCLCFDCDIENGGYVHTLDTTYDYSSKMIYIWAFCLNPPQLDTKTNGGVYIIGRDTSANYGYWYVGGSDNYTGGWRCWVADVSRAPDANSGTAPNMALCDGIGIGFKNLAKSKATHNMFFDYVREADGGDGIMVETTSTTIATWADLASADDAAAIGVIRESGGVYFVQGPITFGDTAGGDLKFDDTAQLVVFEESDVQTGHYVVTVEGATGTIAYQMGDPAGARGISGCVLKTASAAAESFAIVATDTDIDTLYLYGCSFIGAGQTSLPVTAVWREVISCNFEDCGPVLISTCIVTYCNFINSAAEAVQVSSTSHNMTYCNFIGCTVGVQFTAAGTYDFDNIQFTNCTTDVENTVNASTADSYSESNRDTQISLYAAATTSVAQSFDGNAGVLSRARFHLRGFGSPPGNVVAKLYAASAGVPTGTALATSNDVAASSIPTGSWNLIDFEFESEYTVASGSNNYCIAVEYTSGDAINSVLAGVDNSTPTDDGTGSAYTSSWASQTWDACFYVFTGAIVKINATDSNPSTDLCSGTPPGAIIIVNTVTLSVTVKDADNNPVEGVRVRIEETSGGAQVTQGTTNSSGVYSDSSYNYEGDVAVTIKARLKGYKFFRTSGLIEDNGISVTATIQRDRIVDMP
jgi:hypothetical protein